METVSRGSGTVDLAVVLRFVDVAVDALADAREEIDALNVYPVPDGDTGTNMYLTMVAARDAIREATAGPDPADLGTALAALRRGALLGGRGNSGVILSQLLGAVSLTIAGAGADERNASIMARALREASDAGYAAVDVPMEGTMLTVIRAAAEAAEARASRPGARAKDVFTAAAAAAREALAHTPEQLAVLRDAGVVDAGGRGLSVVLDAAETALTGHRPIPVTAPIGVHKIPVTTAGPEHPDLHEDGPAYEVMYLLDADDERIPALKHALADLGDSLVVVGGSGLWNVHVHVDDVGAAVEAGIEAGRPHRIRVTHFAEQVAAAGSRARAHAAARADRHVVAVAAGPGLASLFAEAGATVVPGGPSGRPSTGMILEAIRASGAHEVVVLPNDAPTVRAAQAAAQTAETDDGIRVAVIETESQVQGLAAMAVHEPGRPFDRDVTEMTATARHARHGAVTVAARQAMTMAGPCEPGDVLGVVAGDFAVVGDDLDTVALDVLERLLAGGGELVTLVAGEGGADLAERAAAAFGARHAHVDVVVYDGGQERYPLLMSVE